MGVVNQLLQALSLIDKPIPFLPRFVLWLSRVSIRMENDRLVGHPLFGGNLRGGSDAFQGGGGGWRGAAAQNLAYHTAQHYAGYRYGADHQYRLAAWRRYGWQQL